jgi:predicted dehydrogenase
MIWLIGAGPMAIDYAKVLCAQNREFICITRSEESAANFKTQTDILAISGGLQDFLLTKPEIPTHAIVTTGIEMLSQVTVLLLKFGIKSILVEKPAGLDIQQVDQTQVLVKQCKAKVFVAYNRRFYASVMAAQQMIAEDGGVTSLNYEITEWSHVIADIDIAPLIKQNWFMANTSHVIDLAFYLGGKPKQLASFTSGKTSWHPSSANFAGAGVTESDALFSYHGNWNAPGRWSLEVSTTKRRFIFRPMEQLSMQELGSVAVEKVKIDYQYDEMFKPGIYLQTEGFLKNHTEKMCDLGEHFENMKLYNRMANYAGVND